MEHVVIWEGSHGAIPDGWQVHHKDGDKLNNTIENLELVTPLTHKRLHSGCRLEDGIWWKPCRVCSVFKPIEDEFWYFSKEGWPLYGHCRECHIRRVVESKRRRKQERV